MVNGKYLVEKLIVYAKSFLYLAETDEIYMRNCLLASLRLSSPLSEVPNLDFIKEMSVPDVLFDEIKDYSRENAIASDDTQATLFAASVFQSLGFEVSPLPDDVRSDIIQTITLKTPENLCAFCEAIQAHSPIDAHVTPVPSPLPGYQDDIIMAAGTFVQGASIELSADGPMRAPYKVFMQGGLTFEHGRIAVMAAARQIMEKQK